MLYLGLGLLAEGLLRFLSRTLHLMERDARNVSLFEGVLNQF